MALKTVYQIHKDTFIWYLEILGVDTKEIDNIIKSFGDDENIRIKNFNELQNIGNWYDSIPHSSHKLIEYLNDILFYLCELGNNRPLEKFMYHSAIENILRTATNLNLIEENADNYPLHFERINLILSIVLKHIKTFLDTNPNLIIQFNNFIKNPSLDNLTVLAKDHPLLTYILVVATNDDNDSKDYEIFKRNSENNYEYIDQEKLSMMVIDTYVRKRKKAKNQSNNKSSVSKKILAIRYALGLPLNLKPKKRIRHQHPRQSYLNAIKK